MRSSSALLLFAAACVGPTLSTPEGADASLARSPINVRYDDVQMKGVHNAYQRDEALPDQLVYHRVRAIELDIHTGKTGRPNVAGDWYVYHAWPDTATSCDMLSDCLIEVGAWHRDHPNHDVLTLVLDLKDGFSASWSADDLDAMLVDAFGADLFAPADLLDACPTASNLQAAVTGACDWPTIETLRGRVMVEMTGQANLNAYAGSDAVAATRVGFVGWDVASAADVGAAPDRAVFFNMDVADLAVASTVRSQGFVARAYGVNSSGDWSAALAAGVQQLATDKVNFEVDAWAKTHNSRGFPFACQPGAAGCSLGSADEELDLLLMGVDSGDIWGSADDFAFLYDVLPPNQTHIWKAGVSTANSHIEDYGKGCLMARAAATRGAAYLAVCRPADVHEARVQIRTSSGGGTTATEVDLTPAGMEMDESSVWHLALAVQGRCARGLASADGVTWTTIAQRCFNQQLRYQGIAVSSHGDGLHHYVFSKPMLDGVLVDKAHFDAFDVFGSASASAWDGLYEVSPRLP